MVGVGICIYGFLWYWLWKTNKRRDVGELPREHEGLLEEELKELGDDSPHYRYTI